MWRSFVSLLLAGVVLAGCKADSRSASIAPQNSTEQTNEDKTPNQPNPPSVDPILARLPAGVPEAAKKTLDARPIPNSDIWPFNEGINQTSGTGRYAGGAYYWTDFIYDAYGAFAGPPPAHNLQTPNAGSLTYPRVAVDASNFPGPDMSEPGYDAATDPFQGNGADIFALAVGKDTTHSYWRVDWVTLADTDAPILAFALDTDNDPATGTAGQMSQGWSLIPNIRTAGVDRFILISAAGVYLADSGGTSARIGDTLIDQNSQTFVARISLSELHLSGDMKIYALSGIHDGNGGFFSDMSRLGGLPGLTPPVYNVGFRDYTDEPVANNFWMSNSQAQALAQGDISDFALELDTQKLGDDEPEAPRHGFSVRWYVSSLGPEQFGRAGIYTGQDATIHQTAQSSDDMSLYSGYYDQLQPYSLWVPDTYDFDQPEAEKMTLVLHSFTQNHMQYVATMPNFLRETCNDLRQSFCLTVLGRGVSGFYEFASGVDLWEAWRHVATDYVLDPTQTFTSGFSMGALGSQRLMIKYPDVFAAGVILAGAQSDEPGIADQNGNVPGCFGEIQLENLKWNGYYHAAGTFDQLIPFTQQRDTVNRMRDLGYRYTFDHYHAEDHVAWVLKDGQYPAFAEATDWLIGTSDRGDSAPSYNTLSPGEIIYRFTGNDQHPEFGLGAYGAWWISDLSIADPETPVQGYEPSPSQQGRQCTFTNNFSGLTISPKAGRVHAVSDALPQPEVTGLISPAPVPDGANPQVRPDLNSSPRIQLTGPHTHEFQAWTLGETPAPTGELSLNLQNVATLSVDMRQAGLAERSDWIILVTNDTDTQLTLTQLTDDQKISMGGAILTVENGKVVLNLSAGNSEIRLAP